MYHNLLLGRTAIALSLVATGCQSEHWGKKDVREGAPTGRDTVVNGTHAFVPSEGMVPDSATAVSIGRVVLRRIYGRSQIQSEEPLRARMDRAVWIVEGTLPVDRVGGEALIEINREDGRIIRVSHGE